MANINKQNTYNSNDHGQYGKATEKALKEFLGLRVKVARSGRTDARKRGICYEVKTGAGELGAVGGKLVKGSSMVIYVPVVEEERPINKQEGFVMDRVVFLNLLEECGMIREKTATSGARVVSIQTFWNRKQNKPHGRGLAKMLDAFYGCDEVATLDDWLAQF